ncbi:cytidylyltransferase family protein [Caldivirga sp.]|uniref:cytidylyltransferase family protein n=1 Tax=Caldivirga sp. TaxID=2080243 RepID=UPI0025BF64E6|nr:cytidylyltransferase family protein [Caldivirga sp.]
MNALADRVMTYVRNVEQAIEALRKGTNGNGDIGELIELAEAYLKDTLHYFKVGDYETALATISYAEGLLDALRILKLSDVNWRKPSELAKSASRKVFVAGTFDIIHPGHIGYLKYAWSLGRVVAVVSTDESVRRIKGREPIIPAKQRAEVLGALEYVTKARVGYGDDMFRVVEEEKPDVILLGPNQPFTEDEIRRALRSRGINVEVVRMPNMVNCQLCSTTSIVKRIIEMSKELASLNNH